MKRNVNVGSLERAPEEIRELVPEGSSLLKLTEAEAYFVTHPNGNMQIIVASKGSKAALTYGITELLIDAITPHDGLGKQFVALLEGIQKDLRVIIKEEVLENMTNIAKDILEEITAGLTKQ